MAFNTFKQRFDAQLAAPQTGLVNFDMLENNFDMQYMQAKQQIMNSQQMLGTMQTPAQRMAANNALFQVSAVILISLLSN